MPRISLLTFAVALCAVVAVPTAASAKDKRPTTHHAPTVSVRTNPHAVVIRIAIDRDDANLLCQSDLSGLGARAFIVRWAIRHDLRTALSRCQAARERFRSALVERGSGPATVTTTSLATATTAATTTTTAARSVPASISVQATLTGARPLASGTATVSLSANWTTHTRRTGVQTVCAPTTGSATLSGTTVKTAAAPAAPGTIVMSLTGTLCANGTTASTTGASVFTGAYTITSGTGVASTTAASVVGHGRFALSLGSNNTAKFVAAGGLHS